MRIRLLIALLIGAFSFAAAAAEYPPAVQNLVDRGVRIIEQFDTEAGLTGYVAQVGDQNLIFYATPDGEHVVIGNLLDAQGRNLTVQQARKRFPRPDLGAAWDRLEDAHWIAEGAEDPETVIYEFTDPNCPYCHLFWLANQPYMEEGLQVRHIVVGFLSPSSKMKAAAILAADDPVAAYRRNQENYRSNVPESQAGGVETPENPDPQAVAKVEANNALMQALGVTGTPGVFYKTEDGQVRRVIGLPKLSRLPGMYNLPEQPVDDPRLQSYQ